MPLRFTNGALSRGARRLVTPVVLPMIRLPAESNSRTRVSLEALVPAEPSPEICVNCGEGKNVPPDGATARLPRK